MPRYAYSQLRWSEQAQTYVLSSGNQESRQALSNDWLEPIASFSFHSRSGMRYTVRKQRAQHGNSYWYAYRRLHGRIVKRYLGRTADLTLARLEEIAKLLESMSASQFTPPVSNAEDAGYPFPVGALPLLLSKLSPPRLHASLLDRSHLFTLLDAGQEGPLTLLSAPAGFGKTTLVCQWMAARRTDRDFPPVAWLSLEQADNDPLRFWRYLIAACQQFQVDLQQAHRALSSMTPQPPFVPSSLETVLTPLLNALAQCPAGGILVLEDYHAISAPEIHETISFFLDHLPAAFHVILITRGDPPFSLTRLRARNVLYEVRTADLRFSLEETTILLQDPLPFPLHAPAIQHLDAQLQGWGAGLHLTKLALQRTTTSVEGEQVLAHFSRNNASFQEYFVTEVLDLQPEPVQEFVLRTSTITPLTASLCDAVTEHHNSHDLLTQLERANLFLEPLDTEGQWYRYNALFAEAMRNEARRRLGEDHAHQLSARASHWYEVHGYPGEAIDAALAARDNLRAATLIERFIEEHTFPGAIYEPHTLHRWFEQLPDAILEQHPILGLSYATTLLFRSASWLPNVLTLRSIEKLLRSAEDCFRVENHLPKLGELFAFRSLLAVRQGEVQASRRYAKQALEWLPHGQHLWRGITLNVVAEEWLERGHFQKARAALLEAQARCSAVGNSYFQRVATIKLAQVCFEQGEFQRAASSYRQALEEAREDVNPNWLCHALLGLAAISYETNELERANQHVQEVITVSQSHHLVAHEVRASILLARVQQAQGQVFVAQQHLTALLDKIPVSLPLLAQEIQTAQARLALSAGDQITMQRWVTGHTPHQDFSQEIEEELLVSRWLRTQGKLDEASRQLERLLATAQKGDQTRHLLEIQVELVLLADARKQKEEAQHRLRDVLAQALDRNALRVFVDAGEQMAVLLRSLLHQLLDRPSLAFIRALLSAFPIQPQNGTQTQSASLVDPLSPQEMRVLRLLVEHRSNADIAKALVVSINTVRTQVQSIYTKLGVHKRTAASEVARDLHLL